MSLEEYGYCIRACSDQRQASLRAATYALGVESVVQQLIDSRNINDLEYSESDVIEDDLHHISDVYGLHLYSKLKKARTS